MSKRELRFRIAAAAVVFALVVAGMTIAVPFTADAQVTIQDRFQAPVPPAPPPPPPSPPGSKGGCPGPDCVPPPPPPPPPNEENAEGQRPVVLQRTMPVYPPEAREAKVEGEVKLSVAIGADGSVESTTVLEGPELLQQAAMDAVNQWRFQPGVKDGQPVATTATISIMFHLL